MKVFLDANVLFSAANCGSGIAQLVDLLSGQHEVITSEYAWAEARRNILTKRPNWRTGFEALAGRIAVVPDRHGNVGVALAVKDQPILITAQAQHCEYLVTGDRRDFGHLFGSNADGVQVLSPLMMARLLEADAGV